MNTFIRHKVVSTNRQKYKKKQSIRTIQKAYITDQHA